MEVSFIEIGQPWHCLLLLLNSQYWYISKPLIYPGEIEMETYFTGGIWNFETILSNDCD